jgi:hypothetical protein
VALSRRVKTRCWRVPPITNGTVSIGSVCVYRARCVVEQLITRDPTLLTVGRIPEHSWLATRSAGITRNSWAGRWRRLTRCRIHSPNADHVPTGLVRSWVARCNALTPKPRSDLARQTHHAGDSRHFFGVNFRRGPADARFPVRNARALFFQVG